MRLEPWRADDLDLIERLYGDPAMMEHLGGPESPGKLRERQARYERRENPREDGAFKIIDADTGKSAGWVGYWTRAWRGTEVYETGWSVLPAFQGRGIAAAATAQAIAITQVQRACRWMHAFPSVDNAASNAICRKLGFTLLGPCDVEYPPGSVMRCHDWRLDLRATG